MFCSSAASPNTCNSSPIFIQRRPNIHLRSSFILRFSLQKRHQNLKFPRNIARRSPPCYCPRAIFGQAKYSEQSNSSGGNADDFVTRVLKENPSQVETRYKVGDKLLTLKEKEDLEKKGFDTGAFEILRRLNLKAFSRKSQEEGYQGKPEEVYLKDILREHKGKLYVPEQIFRSNLSEEEEFEKNVEELPKMEFEDFQKYLKTDKVKLLTFKEDNAANYGFGFRDFVVELKEMPGHKSLQRTKWTMRLDLNQAQSLLNEYTGPRYEVEKQMMVLFQVILPKKVFEGVSRYLYRALAVQSEMRKRMCPLLADAELVPTLRADLHKREKELDDSALRIGQLESELEAEKKKSVEAADLAVATYKSSRTFEEDVLANVRSRLKLLAMEWLSFDEGRVYLTDMGEEDYHMRSLDMQPDIYPVLLERDPTLNQEKWGLPAPLAELPSRIPTTLVRQQGAGDPDRVTPKNLSGGQIPMDSSYLNSAANLIALAGMDHNPVPSMLNISEEEEPAEGGLVQRSRLQGSTNDPPPTGSTEGETAGVNSGV